MVVANPAYAGLEPQLAGGMHSNFTQGFYHGSVIWGFVEAMMVEGEGVRGSLEGEAVTAPAEGCHLGVHVGGQTV